MRLSILCLTLLLALPAHAQETAAPQAAPANTAPVATAPTPAPATQAPAPAPVAATPAPTPATVVTDPTPLNQEEEDASVTPNNSPPMPSETESATPTMPPRSRMLRLNQLAMPSDLPAGTKRHDVTSSGELRSFLVHMPQVAPRRGRGAPVIFSFHPAGLTAADQEMLSGLSILADQYGFIVVYPEGRGESPNWAWRPGTAGEQDLEFVTDMVAYVAGLQRLNPRAIFATGMGSGAQMTARIACVLPRVFAAVALVAGNYPQWDDCLARPISAIIFHGTEDHIMPYNGRSLLRGGQGFAERLARANECKAGPGEIMSMRDAKAVAWGECLVGTEVIFFGFTGKGHGWPGSTSTPAEDTSQAVNASLTIWEFFKTHPQQRYTIPRDRR